jgi:putative radical SAM enzyme (TIGR03279 family)
LPEKNKRGVPIEDVLPQSPADIAGLRSGDIIALMNGQRISDIIDYMFARDSSELEIEFLRRGRKHSTFIVLEEGEDPGITLRQFKTNICKCKCIFCFVSQLPRGLRRTLYVKDEDYRMSFLFGNYITLSNLSAEDKKRIVNQRLSPLYISVHTTNKNLRAKILGTSTPMDIMKELRFFKDNRIRMHTQVVLCPGLNDDAELKRTIRDLYSLYPYVVSIAIVPVGLTSHRKTYVKPVKKEDAGNALDIISIFQKRFRKKHGDSIVYGADELYIKAGRSLPPIKDYDDLHQLENGVGMVQLFMSQAKKIKPVRSKRRGAKKYLTFTGVAFYPYLKKFTDRLVKNGISITIAPVRNTFFGESVTVTGLLTGRDVLKSLHEIAGEHDELLIPDVVLRESGDVFLDDVSANDIEAALNIKTKVINSTPEGMMEGILGDSK